MTHEAWRRGGFRVVAFAALFLWPLWFGGRMLVDAARAMVEVANEVPEFVREVYTFRHLLAIWTGGRSEAEFQRREAVARREEFIAHLRRGAAGDAGNHAR